MKRIFYKLYFVFFILISCNDTNEEGYKNENKVLNREELEETPFIDFSISEDCSINSFLVQNEKLAFNIILSGYCKTLTDSIYLNSVEEILIRSKTESIYKGGDLLFECYIINFDTLLSQQIISLANNIFETEFIVLRMDSTELRLHKFR